MIYLLHDDPVICAQMLDDKSLDKQIKAITQVLCGAYFNANFGKHIPDFVSLWCIQDKFTEWASTCLANYKKLVEMGLACCEEYKHREGCDHAPHDEYCHTCECYTEPHKLQPVIEWARDNVPDLPESFLSKDNSFHSYAKVGTTAFPLVMPDKYKIQATEVHPTTGERQPRIGDCAQYHLIESYRNYYRTKIKANATYTRRERPEWLTLEGN